VSNHDRASVTSPARFSTAEIKAAFSHFTTGVTVITGQSGGTPYGFTCQSFVALSLDPTYFSFCPSRNSQSWPVIRTAGAVSVNILADDQAALCEVFSRKSFDRFAETQWRQADNGSPALDGVLARIEADIVDEIDAGDHTIVVAEPTGFWIDSARSPLLYYQGAFGCPHGCADSTPAAAD
jgi:flavin reductase (DIM6/NTAB) family NADH-FMN oxidoreductase RutF